MPHLFELNPLLTIALLFVAGHLAGLLARRFGAPAVTGNILAGIALGPSVLNLFDPNVAYELEPVTVFAMGLMTVVIGGHLSYRRLHNAKRRIATVMAFEVGLTGGLVMAGAYWLERDWATAILLGAIATATAPATLLSIVREERAKGLLVKTLLASVALDNVVCVVLFSIATASVASVTAGSSDLFWINALAPVRDIVYSTALGAAAGLGLVRLVRAGRLPSGTGLFIAILLTTGGGLFLGISPLLASLVLGVILGNSGREGEELVATSEGLWPILLTCFFTLAGAELALKQLPAMGTLGAVYFLARAVGKVGGGNLGARLSIDMPRIRSNLGPALLPQAGLAIGLVVTLRGDARFSEELVTTITNVVLAAVVLNELIGPPLARRSVIRAGEAGMDRRRILEFLQEEHMMTPLVATDRFDAIRQLATLLIRSHGVTEVTVDELVASVEEREQEFTTAIGSGVALPHGRLSAAPEIMGVMGICHLGIDFDAPDEQKVHFIIMIATPVDHAEMHLQVMRAVTRMMSDPEVRTRLFTALNPAEAFEAVETGVEADYNYFLED